jgi:16S rRNA C1402 (ribose-2'-O) methylase RsmI
VTGEDPSEYKDPDPGEPSSTENETSSPPSATRYTLSATRSPLAPGLYLVATPIGNLEDITLRALRVLASVDRIACEDTRQTAKLLNHFGLHIPTVSYHAHNEEGRTAELIEPLRAGGRLAVVSDAGTPAIADPGSVLVREAIAAGVAVFGPDHRIALARELTKLHEEFLRGTAAQVLATLEARPAVRGEMVLVIDGTPIAAASTTSATSIAAEVAALMRLKGLTEKDALKRVARARGLGKSEAYREWQRSRDTRR